MNAEHKRKIALGIKSAWERKRQAKIDKVKMSEYSANEKIKRYEKIIDTLLKIV